ncbi:MAG: hypothetical protein GY714_05595 [Desulfobacterales bacterium]|nr:hypothetical protein [Desulfobacterales bacterium]MCP4163371.1 hypothetical protein [Deltaproteobacteria bacterium]
MKKQVLEFSISVATDRDEIELTRLLTKRIPKDVWGSFRVDIVETEDSVDEFDFKIYCHNKFVTVTEDDTIEFFNLIKNTLTKQGFPVDKYPY